MKPSSLFRLLKTVLLLGLLQPLAALALDEGSSPLFGGYTLSIHGQSFDWDQSTSWDDGTWRYDYYSDSTNGGWVTVTGWSSGYYLATASGSNIDGYLEGGTYYDSTQQSTSSTDYTVNGRHYTSVTSTTYNTVDLYAGQVTSTYGYEYSGDGISFSVSIDGDGNGNISGSEAGLVMFGNWYVNENYSTTGNYNVNGHNYQSYTSYINYVLDSVSIQVVSEGYYTYSGTDGSYSYSWNAYGDSYLSDVGSVTYSDTTTVFMLFGNSYYRTSSSWNYNTNYYSWGGYSSNNQSNDYYATNNGGSLAITASSDDTGNSTNTISGWDPYAGSFYCNDSTDINNIAWDARTSPCFAPSQFWINGTLASWQYGSIDVSGYVIDTYVGGAEGEITINVSGSAHDYFLGSSSAAVTVDGNSAGTYSAAGEFNVIGWDIENGAPNRETPFFSTAALWVDGAAYPFSYGYEDTAGNRADIYATSGGRVSIVGNTGDPATGSVWVNHNGVINAGSVTFGTGGSFTVPGVNIYFSAPPSGPDAFWVGGTFYLQTASPNSYASFPTAGGTLELSGTDATALNVSVTNAAGTYLGTFNSAAGGVFMVTLTGQSQMLPACAAQADGRQVPAGTAPEGFPPAVRMLDAFWNYLGEATDDGAAGSTAAYYGNTRTPIFRTDPNDPAYLLPLVDDDYQLLKIQVGGSLDTATTVTMTDYTAATSTTGSYLPSARLFQTIWGAANALTMPVVGVDPQSGDTIWILTPPEGSGLPASFIVRGQPWRLASYDAATDTATYQGLYDGQLMSLSAADTTSGQRLVTLVDPVYNNGSTTSTEGTLSSVRDSVRLRDGTMVFSGTDEGQQQVVQHDDNFQLQTISADLDVVGNNISFGLLQGDASLAAALFQFEDLLQTNEDSTTTSIANLNSTLSRPHAQWQWMRAVSTNGQSTLPVMKLDASNKLTLYDRSSGDAGVMLDPTPDGVSTIRGVLRVRPGGDIGMGGFTAGGEP